MSLKKYYILNRWVRKLLIDNFKALSLYSNVEQGMMLKPKSFPLGLSSSTWLLSIWIAYPMIVANKHPTSEFTMLEKFNKWTTSRVSVTFSSNLTTSPKFYFFRLSSKLLEITHDNFLTPEKLKLLNSWQSAVSM